MDVLCPCHPACQKTSWRTTLKKISLVAGARPNFMKIAPIVRALQTQAKNTLEWSLVHTGQHYDHDMSESFFNDLEIPKPNFFLEAGSGSHAEQTAKIMVAYEQVCIQEKPDIVLVVGDVNSTLACSIVAKKLSIEVAHVEAGLRSFDLSMPEEINRMVTDSISDYFFVTEKQGKENLLQEGKPESKIHFVGHVMIDNLLFQLSKVKKSPPALFKTNRLKEELGAYCFLTLHRPSNVDNKETISGIIAALNYIAEKTPIIFPVHPRTKKMLAQFNLQLSSRIHQLPPLGFQESLFLWKDSQFVLTDSGGIQEETTGLGIPCFTLRENTERPITIEKGTNILVGPDKNNILAAYERFQKGERKAGQIPELWDGKAAERIVAILGDAS